MKKVLLLMFLASPLSAQQAWYDSLTPAQRHVIDLGNCYASHMGFGRPWTINANFVSMDSTPELKGYLAAVEVDLDYYTVWLDLDKSIGHLDDSSLRATWVHELVHVQIWELAELAGETDEKLALRLEEQVATRFEAMEFWRFLCREGDPFYAPTSRR